MKGGKFISAEAKNSTYWVEDWYCKQASFILPILPEGNLPMQCVIYGTITPLPSLTKKKKISIQIQHIELWYGRVSTGKIEWDHHQLDFYQNFITSPNAMDHTILYAYFYIFKQQFSSLIYSSVSWHEMREYANKHMQPHIILDNHGFKTSITIPNIITTKGQQTPNQVLLRASYRKTAAQPQLLISLSHQHFTSNKKMLHFSSKKITCADEVSFWKKNLNYPFLFMSRRLHAQESFHVCEGVKRCWLVKGF